MHDNQVSDTGLGEPLVVITSVSPFPYNLGSLYLFHTLIMNPGEYMSARH